MYNKSRKYDVSEHPKTAEGFADVLYELGKDMLLREKNYEFAITWLDRAFEIFRTPEPQALSQDAGELQTSILQASIKARLEIGSTQRIAEARGLLQRLEGDIGGKLVVLLLKLELLSSTGHEPPDADGYDTVLRTMMASLVLNEDNFKLIIFHVRKLQQWNSTLACAALEKFLTGRVVVEGKLAQLEKIIMMRFHMSGENDTMEGIVALERFVTLAEDGKPIQLSPGASLGIHTVSLPLCGLSHADPP